MVVCEVRVVFVDGQQLELEDVSEYGYNENSNSYYVVKNNRRQFFNKDQVKYIGRIFDLDNEKRR